MIDKLHGLAPLVADFANVNFITDTDTYRVSDMCVSMINLISKLYRQI